MSGARVRYEGDAVWEAVLECVREAVPSEQQSGIMAAALWPTHPREAPPSFGPPVRGR